MYSERLEQSYLRTVYRVETPEGPIDLRVGHRSPALDTLLYGQGVECWAFITAANPGSCPLAAEQNELRNARLRARLGRLGFRFYEGAGIPDDGNWAPEPSYLVAGIELEDALELAGRFGQNAIVAGRTGEPARLAWTGARSARRRDK